jgi:hypothetical protein
MREWRQFVLPERAAVVALCGILVVGGWLRLSGSNWDQGRHLHPDERYLSIVADNVRVPGSLGGYLDVRHSPLSPYNTQVGRGYVYGTLPLFAVKLTAAALGQADYEHLYLVGRRLSALLDLCTTILVFLLARLLLRRAGARFALLGALGAAAAYAVTVTAVQFSHFATVESWLVFFATLTLYLGCRAAVAPVRAYLIETPWLLTGAAAGLTVACKASGALIVAPIALGVAGRFLLVLDRGVRVAVTRSLAAVASLAVPCYLCYRLVSPYTFAKSSWLDFAISPAYRTALDAQQAALDGKNLAPPGYQWLLSPRVWSPFENLVVWQLGLALGAAAVAGVLLLLVLVARKATRVRAGDPDTVRAVTVQSMLVAAVLVPFFWSALLFAHSGRYLVALAPLLAVAAAFGLARAAELNRVAAGALATLVLTLTGLYAIAYHTIYRHPTTRVAASSWIVAHVPQGSVIANEHWDDSLPIGGDFAAYDGLTVPVFDADDNTKLAKLLPALQTADYYMVSSPRAWRTIGRLPTRFPLMVRYYRALLGGRLGFRKVATFTSEPSIFGLELHDIGAEEAFWVYDHPPVMIFERTRRLSTAAIERRLCVPRIPGVCEVP